MIITREQWGARPPARPPQTDALPYRRVWLHHSVTGQGGAAVMRQIQNDHIGRGWRDIAYQYGVGSDGIYEGIRGRHLNSDAGQSATILLLGNFDTTSVPAPMIERAAWLVAHGLLAGWWSTGLTGGHRDIPGAAPTACPGRHAHAAIPTINARAAQIIRSLDQENDMNADQDTMLKALHQALVAGFPGPGPHKTHNHGFAIQHMNGGVGRIEAAVSTLAGQVGQVRQLAMAAATPDEVAGIVDASLGALVDALEGMTDPHTGETMTRTQVVQALAAFLNEHLEGA